jgi:hypothetical protein
MPELRFPSRLPAAPPKSTTRTCAGHRAWVRRHCCSVPGCRQRPIECAHVRIGTDGGAGMKPSDKWVLSLCTSHHREQHRIGEHAFEQLYCLDLKSLASEFAARSPYRRRLDGA